MKSQFDKYRKCYYMAMATCVIIMIAAGCLGLAANRITRMALEIRYLRYCHGISALAWLFAIVLSWLMWRNSKCPHCGKSVFPFWGSFKIQSRILKRKPILCAHCGEEVETG